MRCLLSSRMLASLAHSRQIVPYYTAHIHSSFSLLPPCFPRRSLAPCSLAPCSLAPCSLAPCSLAPCPLAPCPLAPCPLAPCPLAPCPLAPCCLAPRSLVPRSLARCSLYPCSPASRSLLPRSVSPTLLTPTLLTPTLFSTPSYPPALFPPALVPLSLFPPLSCPLLFSPPALFPLYSPLSCPAPPLARNAMQTEDRLPSLEEQGVRQLFPSTKNISEHSQLNYRTFLGASKGKNVREKLSSITRTPPDMPSCHHAIMSLCPFPVFPAPAWSRPRLSCPLPDTRAELKALGRDLGLLVLEQAGSRAGGATLKALGRELNPLVLELADVLVERPSCRYALLILSTHSPSPPSSPLDTRAELKALGQLKALGRELGLLVLELADVLVERPSQAGRCVEDISLLFTNLHFLLNSLRPHQARATLTHILKTQLEMRKQSLQGIKEQRAAVWEVLRLAVGEVEAATQGVEGGGTSSKGGAEGAEVEGGGGGKQQHEGKVELRTAARVVQGAEVEGAGGGKASNE
ncbi:unnamed protein product [Closterium sp. Naga37s-1]|nr:unnamed protein product [Closterium sp. Naga37s-1]